MAYSIYTAYGDGVTNQFTISFGLGYIDKADVKCRVNKEVDGLGQHSYRPLTWITDSLVQVGGTVPANGNLVEFTRTVSKTSLVHDYSDGVEIQEKNLDDSNKQILMAVQEVLDGRFESGLATDLDFANHRAINIAAGTNLNDAVNLAQLQDMTGNAPVYAAAASVSASAATTQAGLATTAKADAEAARDVAQAAAAGMKWRPDVKVATTANITLSGTQTIDGVAVIAGDRVLVKNQTTTSQNGVYVVAAGAWSRATDADTWNKLISQVVSVNQGAVNADLIFICTVDSGGTIGSTSVTWVSINLPLQDNEVTTNKIIDGAITFLKIASSAIASVSDIINSVANKLVTAANFKAGLRGLESYTLLLSQTASNSASLNFVSLITSEFDEYIFEFIDIYPSTSAAILYAQLSSDNGTTWLSTANYSRAGRVNLSGSTVTSSINLANQTQMGISGSLNTASRYALNGSAKLFTPLSTQKSQRFMFNMTYANTTPEYEDLSGTCHYDQPTLVACNAIRFYMSSGNIASGTIRMYGVRKA